MINYWSFNNNYVDSVTGYALTSFNGYNGFVADRNGRASSAVSLSAGWAQSSGGCQTFSSILSVSVWLYSTVDNSNCFLTYGSNGQYCYLIEGGYIKYVDASIVQFGAATFNQWIHYGFTISGSTISFYQNGLYQSSQTWTIPGQTGTNACWIGGSVNRNAGYNGYIDDVMYFNYVLTAAQMLAAKNYNV